MSPRLILAGGMAIALLALTSWALLERGWRLEAEARAVVLASQGQVVADALMRCSAGVQEVKDVSTRALAGLDAALAKVREFSAPKWRTVQRTETIIEKPAPPGAGCDQAWDLLEAEAQKARATP